MILVNMSDPSHSRMFSCFGGKDTIETLALKTPYQPKYSRPSRANIVSATVSRKLVTLNHSSNGSGRRDLN